MNALWLLTTKNIRLLLRTKGSALIVIFAPLLIILVLGLAFNNAAPFGITIGVHSSSFSEEVNSFMDTLRQEESFKVVPYEESLQECLGDVRLGFVHTCLEVPPSFTVQENLQKEIIFHIDPSKVTLVFMIQQTLREKFQLKSKELSQELSQNILNKLSDTKSQLAEKHTQLQGIRDRSSSASSSTETIKASLTGIDATTPAMTYDSSAVGTVNSTLASALEKIQAVKTDLNERNISGGEALVGTLEEAGEKVASAKDSLLGEEAGSLGLMIIDMKADIAAAQAKLQQVSEAIASSTQALSATGSTLQETTTSLDGVISSLGTVKGNLDTLSVTDANVIAAPLVSRVEKVVPEGTYLNYLFPALLVLVVMFSSLLLGSTTVMMEKNSPAYLRNFFVPIRKITFITSIYLTTLFLTVIQILIILLVALFFLPEISGHIPLIFFILLIAASVFTFLGMAIGYLFTSEETGLLASISLGSILLFVSGVILPIESVAPWMRELIHLNPFVIAEKLIREVVLFQAEFSVMWLDFATLAGYAVVLLLVVMVIEAIIHQHLIHRFMKKHHKIHADVSPPKGGVM